MWDNHRVTFVWNRHPELSVAQYRQPLADTDHHGIARSPAVHSK